MRQSVVGSLAARSIAEREEGWGEGGVKRGGNLWRPSHARDGWSSLAPFVASRSEGTITRDKSAQEKTNDAMIGAENSTSEAKSQELLYAARFSLHRTEMQVEDKMVNLSPGMAVTVEIKTGERTVMSYLLSPLLRYKQETLRER